MPTKRHPLAKAALPLILLAVVAGIAFWLRSDVPPSSPPDPGTEATAATAPTAGGAPAAAAPPPVGALPTTPVTPAPLPSLAAPLALVIDELRTRSEAGDRDAACRLAAELAACSQASDLRADYDRWLAQRHSMLARLTDEGAKRRMATETENQMEQRESLIDNLSSHCEGTPATTPDQIAAQWRHAALLGSPAAMKQYASGNAFRWSNLMDSLPALAVYRAEAEAMALRVARDGDAGMLLALASGYDPMSGRNRSLLAQSLRQDGARALAMYRHARSSIDSMPPSAQDRIREQLDSRIATLEASLPPEERVRANELAQRELAAWSPPAFADSDRFRQVGGQQDVHRFACGAPPGETVRRRRSAAPAP
jgi:hypothetical protein